MPLKVTTEGATKANGSSLFRAILFHSIVLLLVSSRPAGCQHLENDLQALLQDIDVNQHHNPLDSDDNDDFEVEIFYRPTEDEDGKSTISSQTPVRRLWGIGDTEAAVGRVFRYPIPDDAFQGKIKGYQVIDPPSWLWYDAHGGVVEGVPSVRDRGHHYLTIKATGEDGSHAKDVFAVLVKDVPVKAAQKEGKCHLDKKKKKRKEDNDLTMMSLLVDTRVLSLNPREAVSIVTAAAKILNISRDQMSLAPAPHNYDPLADDAAILAGPGSHHGVGGKEAALLQWVVGCGGEVSPTHQGEVDKAELIAKDGVLEASLGLPVLGWLLSQVHPRSGRTRRSIDSSGDYADDHDYGEYDDYIYTEYDTDDMPESRIIPTLASPAFGPMTISPQETRLRPEYVTPVLRPVPMSTPVLVPVKPTRIAVLETSPTYEPSHVPMYGLESSIIMAEPTSHTQTVPLTVPNTLTDLTAPPTPLEPTSVPNVPVTEYAWKNRPPEVHKRMEKLSWIVGHYYRLKVPANMFVDFEDGDARHLRLVFKTMKDTEIGTNSWIQFDPVTQEIYALPQEDDIGRWTFQLQAIDSGKSSADDTIHIQVWQARESRNYHHKFTVTFKLEKKYEYEFKYSLDWQVLAVEKLAELYNSSVDTINVRSISHEPYKITWTNVSLVNPSANICPSQQLERVAEVILSGSAHEPTKAIKAAFNPEFHIKRIHAHYMQPCDHQDQINRKYTNVIPAFRNQIDSVDFYVGMYKKWQIPKSTCYDTEDGDSRGLTLRLRTSDHDDLPRDSWLQFDTINQEFFGVPLSGDIKTEEYILECKDRNGGTAHDALVVTVKAEESPGPPPVIFTLKIARTFREFMTNANKKALLLEKIGRAFGDYNTSSIRVKSFTSGSVVVTWFNASLPSRPCPDDQIVRLRRIVMDDDGLLRQEFVQSFAPDFKVTGASVNPSGECLAGGTPTHAEEPDVALPPPTDGVTGSATSRDEEEDYLLTFIVPAVIITVMLFVAAVIACCLYRRRRYGKMTMADDRTFVSKGIPIIFAEELDDQHQPPHRADPAKSPVIMKEEKPPLPPPEYHHQRSSPPPHMGGSSPLNPPIHNERPHSGGSSDDTPYHPPPPFTNAQSRNQRPNMPPAYRKPPTYVPP